MKRRFTLAIVLLLCLAILWGCGDKKEAGSSASLYYNLDMGAQLTPDANGAYTVNFMLGTEKKAFTVTDKALLEQLLLLDFMGLELEGDTVTGIIRMPDMPYSRISWNYYVQSIGGNTVKLNSLANFAGKEIVLKLPENLPAYDISSESVQLGAATQIQKYDSVSVIADETGEPVLAYVTSRPAIPHEEQLYCEHCKSQVSWSDWVSTTSLPMNSGHYILKYDVTVSRDTNLGAVDICLDLAGKTVTQSTFGQRIYSLESSGTLSIMDSAGGGTFVPNSTDESSKYQRYGMVILVNHSNGTLNLYNGTMDATNCTAQTGCAVSLKSGTFNMYGGTILGGTAYGTGSSAISANGIFNMYGGRIVGGKHISTNYTPANPPGGAAVRVLGITTIYDGIIEGGESYSDGGAVRVCPDAQEAAFTKLILKGGTITGGKAPRGGGIYAINECTIVISGNVKITGNENGNLFLGDGVTISIGEEGLGEEAQIGVSMDQSGNFLDDAPEGVDILKHFTSDNPSQKIVSTGNGWGLK